jgi:stage II sporulation protein GA (sporulation sigma-E factor processing peptidase)
VPGIVHIGTRWQATVIYGDLYGLGNAGMDLLLVWGVGRMLGERVPPWRLVAAALVGGSYATLTLLPPFLPLAGLGGRLATAALMVAAAFGMTPRYWRELLAFFAVSFAAAGLAFGVDALCGPPALALPAPLLPFLAGAAVVVVVEIGRRLLAHRARASGLVPLVLEVAGKGQRLPALVDSGCRLQDPFSRWPVVVVERGALAGLVPTDILQAAGSGDPGDLARAVERHPAWADRLRPLPFVSLGREDGLMWGFRPDSVRLGVAAEVAAARVVVGIAPHALSLSGEFQAIVPPELLFPSREGGAA